MKYIITSYEILMEKNNVYFSYFTYGIINSWRVSDAHERIKARILHTNLDKFSLIEHLKDLKSLFFRLFACKRRQRLSCFLVLFQFFTPRDKHVTFSVRHTTILAHFTILQNTIAISRDLKTLYCLWNELDTSVLLNHCKRLSKQT
jgi:hypothetical protein